MNLAGCNGRPAPFALALALAAGLPALAQDGPPRTVIAAPMTAVAPPGTAVTVDEAVPEAPGLPADVQVVRFHGPEGVKIEVLDPAPEAVPQRDGKGLLTVGMKVGTGYRLKITGIPERPGVELFPVVEVVGHLHRPAKVDPGKFPIRIVFDLEDLYDAADRARLVTRVIYLENPDMAVPLKLDKDTPPSLDLNPAEEPLRVASALGRVMAIVRLGLRKPLIEDLAGPAGDGLARGGCPFTMADGGRCGLPCGPVVGTAPPANRPWLPRDEYLCDGGDRDIPIHFGGDGGLRGIDPRDTTILFHDNVRPRVLPTNTVCIYAPRFASVRLSIGANESLSIDHINRSERVQHPEAGALRQGPKKFEQNAALEAARHRSRASGLSGRVYAGEHGELRILAGVDLLTHMDGHTTLEGPESLKVRTRAMLSKKAVGRVELDQFTAIRITGAVQGGGQMIMTWDARELAGVETPPNKPGIQVIKQVDVDQAEPGDTVTYTIRFKNIGNSAIKVVSIVDSLMPRLEYVANSATGPRDTIFTAAPNSAGTLELRWDLADPLLPNAEGMVSFKAVVR